MRMRGNICKNQVKIFNLLYLKIEDAFVISHAGTLKDTMEGETNNFGIDAFQGKTMVYIGDGRNMHTTIFEIN